MYTVPNQNTIVIHKEMPKSNFLQIKNENWQNMLLKTRDPYAFVLYLYLASNANGYKFALSQQAIENEIGLAKSTFYKKMHVLKDAGYIIEGKGNQLHFYEVPQTTKSRNEEIENNNCGGLSWEHENLAREFENLGQRKSSLPQEQNSSPQNIEIDNRYNIDKDKIIQTSDILESEETTPPNPDIFVF